MSAVQSLTLSSLQLDSNTSNTSSTALAGAGASPFDVKFSLAYVELLAATLATLFCTGEPLPIALEYALIIPIFTYMYL